VKNFQNWFVWSKIDVLTESKFVFIMSLISSEKSQIGVISRFIAQTCFGLAGYSRNESIGTLVDA